MFVLRLLNIGLHVFTYSIIKQVELVNMYVAVVSSTLYGFTVIRISSYILNFANDENYEYI